MPSSRRGIRRAAAAYPIAGGTRDPWRGRPLVVLSLVPLLIFVLVVMSLLLPFAAVLPLLLLVALLPRLAVLLMVLL